MRKIENIDLNIGQAYLSEWTIDMAIRELIANAIDEAEHGIIDIGKISEGVWKITNKGSEIKPANFLIKEGEKNKEKGKIGKFGIGLKDAIGVLMSRGILVKIFTSEYQYIAEYRKKSKIIDDKCLFINIYNNTRELLGTEVILENCKDHYIEDAKSHFLIYRDKKMIEKTKYGDVLLENDENKNGTIYFNGIKIAYEKTFFYSYNIKIEENKLKEGISRERCDLSREIYKDSLKQIIKCIKSEEISSRYYTSFVKTRDGSLKGELVYTDTQLKVIEYIIKHNIKAVLFPAEREGRLITLYKELYSRKGIITIKLLNSYYSRLQKEMALIENNILADNYKAEYTEIKIDDLSELEKSYFKLICDIVKGNTPSNIISNFVLVKENMYAYIHEEGKIIIPIEALGYIKNACLKIFNVIEESVPYGKNIKDEVVGKYIDIEINKKDRK
jgi:hypothetical protein